MTSPSGSSQPGFSLIELVVVIMVAAILAAVALGSMDSNTPKAGALAAEIRSAVRYAQKVAVAQRRNVYVCVTAAGVSLHYAVACNSPVASPTDGSAFAVSATNLTHTYASVAVTISPVGTFFFDAQGRPNPAGSITVASAGGAQTITVEAESGFVH